MTLLRPSDYVERMWMRKLTYADGRWRGVWADLEVHSTWYGVAKFRKGSVPPPRVEKKVTSRTEAVAARIPQDMKLVVSELAKLWNAQWRGAKNALDGNHFVKLAKPTLLLFNAGETGDEYMLFFPVMREFGGRAVKLVVSRGAPKYLVVEAPMDAKGNPTKPWLGVEKQHVTLRPALLKSATTKPIKPAPKPVKPVKLVWKAPLRFDAASTEWRGTVDLSGKRLPVVLGVPSDREAARAKAIQQLEALLRNLPTLMTTIGVQLAALHEESWADTSKPPIDAVTVLRRVKLKTLTLDGARFTLLLTDGGLFAGHFVEAVGERGKLRSVGLAG